MNVALLVGLGVLAGCHCAPRSESAPPGDTRDSGTVEVPVSIEVALVHPEDTPPVGGATLGLVHVSFGDGPAIGPTLASAAVAGADVALVLPGEVAPELIADLGEALGGALFALVVFEDADEDGAWAQGEPLLGIAMDRWLLWAHRDCYGCDTAEEPADEWRVVDLGIAGQYAPNRCALDSSWPMEWMADQGYPVQHALDEPIALTLRGLEATLAVEGDIAGLDRADLRLAALPYPQLGEREVVPWMDQALGAGQARFAGDLEGEPPAEDDVGSDPDWRYTMHLLLPYLDGDGSGGWTLGDTLEGATACLDDAPVWARYTRAVHSYRGYRFLDCYAGTVGWRLAHYGDGGAIEYLSSAQARALALDFASCRLD